MIVYRISKAAHARDLSGTGARIHGARWNKKGAAIVYAASNPALATVELLVHVDANLQSSNLRLVFVEVSDAASSRTIESDSLPRDWRTFPAPAALAEIGSDWAERRQTLVLRVPSAVVVEDHNVLLNPLHPEFVGVRIVNESPYGFDEPLLRRR